MIIGPLSRSYRQARVWVGELPEKIEGQEVLTVVKTCVESATIPSNTMLAVELKINISPSYMYGLLGGVFHREASGELRVLMHTSESKDRPFADSLVRHPSDRVLWALPREYNGAILETIMQQKSMPSGTLEINCAAFSEVGSNQVIFARLSQVLVSAIRDNLSPEQIAAITLESSGRKAGIVLGQQ
jgi:hypothetical protein